MDSPCNHWLLRDLSRKSHRGLSLRYPIADESGTIFTVTRVLGHGVYTISEAARLVGVSHRQAKAWFSGWTVDTPGVLGKSDYTDMQRPDLVSFLDLVDVLVVGQLRKQNISMPAIRRAYRIISSRLNSPHPFGRQELYADTTGRLFYYAGTESGDESLVELVSGQAAFPKILLRYLQKIEYDPDSRLARRITLGQNIAIDAQMRYGKPIVVSAGMPTALLAGAYKANNRDAEHVADWYNVSVTDVMDAVDFEKRFVGIAA